MKRVNYFKEVIRIIGAESKFSKLEVEIAINSPSRFIAAYNETLPDNYNVWLVSCENGQRIPLIKEVREILNINLLDAKIMVETPNSLVASGLPWERAILILNKLKSLGAEVEVRKNSMKET